MRKLAVLAAGLLIGVVSVTATPAARQVRGGSVTFDAASVKPSKVATPGIMTQFTPGRVLFGNAPIHLLIEYAYNVRAGHIMNAPAWVDSDRYDVLATFDTDLRGEERAMMQALLAQRFGLRVHAETREMPIYALVKARADGTLGPGLKPFTGECVRPAAGGATPNCLMRIATNVIDARGTEWRQLNLSLQIGVWDRPIVDRTGLTGRYDVKLEWTPDPGTARSAEGAAAGAAANAATGERVSIFTALQEQLGLKLESTRGPVDVLVVDAIDRPTPD